MLLRKILMGIYKILLINKTRFCSVKIKKMQILQGIKKKKKTFSKIKKILRKEKKDMI